MAPITGRAKRSAWVQQLEGFRARREESSCRVTSTAIAEQQNDATGKDSHRHREDRKLWQRLPLCQPALEELGVDEAGQLQRPGSGRQRLSMIFGRRQRAMAR